MVVTDSLQVARYCSALFGCYALHVPSLQDDEQQMLARAGAWAEEAGVWGGEGAVLVLSGKYEANADMQPELSILQPAEEELERVDSLRQLRRTQSITA